jgi:hypothetical protein
MRSDLGEIKTDVRGLRDKMDELNATVSERIDALGAKVDLCPPTASHARPSVAKREKTNGQSVISIGVSSASQSLNGVSRAPCPLTPAPALNVLAYVFDTLAHVLDHVVRDLAHVFDRFIDVSSGFLEWPLARTSPKRRHH